MQQAEANVRLENYTAADCEINNQFEYISDLKNSVAARGRDKVKQLQFEEAIQLKLDIQEWTDIKKSLLRWIQEK